MSRNRVETGDKHEIDQEMFGNSAWYVVGGIYGYREPAQGMAECRGCLKVSQKINALVRNRLLHALTTTPYSWSLHIQVAHIYFVRFSVRYCHKEVFNVGDKKETSSG